MTLRRIGLLGALMALVPAVLPAQEPATGVVVGRVLVRADTAAPSPARGAAVTIQGTSRVGTSGFDGRFLLDAVPAGTRTLRVRLAGYRTVERAIRLRGGDTAQVDVTLERAVQLLSPVRTDARRAETELFLTKPSISTLAIDASALAGVPRVGEPDVVRIVQLMPGVVARNDFNTGLTVRGGEADQNLVLLDGFPIYNPFHLGGLFSTFMDATVGGIELLTGAFPARYGGRLSSVLDVRSAEELRPGVHTTADISALGATARMAGGFGGGTGTWSIAGRRTYADAVQSIFTDNVFPYHFRDVQAHAAYVFANGTRVSVTAYEGKDVLDANLAEFEGDSVLSKSNRGRWAFDWGNQLLGVVVAKELGARTTIEQRLSTSGFSTRLDLGSGASAQRSQVRDVRAAGALRVRGDVHDRSIGYELMAQRIRHSSGSPQTETTRFDLTQRPLTAAAWVDDLWQLSPRWLLQGGLRAEALSGRSWAALSPRLSLKYFVTPELALTAGAGRVTQTMHSLAGDGALRYFDVWLASDSFIPVATSWHWIAGAERRMGDAGSVRVEGYVKQYGRVLVADPSEDPQRRGDEFLPATGLSYGADLLARWRSRNGASGWVTYTYGVSRRTRAGRSWAPGSDRRHDLNVVATRPFAKYLVGARFNLATGTPYTPIVGGLTRRVYDPSLDRWGTGDPEILIESIGGVHNSERFPANHRLDLDVSREFFVRSATLAPYLGIANVYNAKNVFVYLYKYSTAEPTRRAISQFPILPSAGLRVAF
ncbi:MAG TPA: TonB-dependent receptor [Gemmatimonadaceae bacterium]|nr:TonB-dependent receptor [Gemmatimonadaceae bacterium]